MYVNKRGDDDQSRKSLVAAAVVSLDAAIAARPPKEVAKALVGRIRSVKHAPRANEAGCAALEASLRREARSFAVQDAASAEKVTPDLPPFPTRAAAAVALRETENLAWSAAPAAARAAVWSGLAFDSHALGTAAPLQEWPKLRGRPTLVAHPLTVVDGVELATVKSIGALAKKLVHGEKSEKGKAGEEKSG